jgi:rubrerythrin
MLGKKRTRPLSATRRKTPLDAPKKQKWFICRKCLSDVQATRVDRPCPKCGGRLSRFDNPDFPVSYVNLHTK